MPFRLKNAPAVFQSILESVLRPVASVCANYINDIIVFSEPWEDYFGRFGKSYQARSKHLESGQVGS